MLRLRLIFVGMALCTAGSGCAIVDSWRAQPRPLAPTQFERADPSLFTTEKVEAAWWKQFNDPALSELVESALRANRDVKVALSQLSEARAIEAETRFERYPRVAVGASVEGRRLSQAQLPGQPRTSRDNPLYTTGFDAFWEIDLFGRLKRESEAARADTGSAEANLRDVQTIVIAEVARAYFELRGAQRQLGIARENVRIQEETFALTQTRFDLGRGTDFDTARAQAQLQLVLASIPTLEAASARAEHRIAMLVGARPEDVRVPPAQPLAPLEQRFPIGAPQDLLRRRPDIVAAERRLEASSARVGVAAADLFPRVTLTGFVGLIATSVSGLGHAAAALSYSVGPSLSWSAIDPRLRARVGAAEARAQAALDNYEGVVLRALEETENAFVTFGRQQASLIALRQSAIASKNAAQLARLRFDYGIADFLVVLDAERVRIDAVDRVAQTETQLHISLVAIYKALGGGWEIAEEAGSNQPANTSATRLP
jgi:multidrug efflux system outer membrane protein